MPRFDTSFNFGANVSGAAGKSPKKPKAAKRNKARVGRSTASKSSHRYFAGMHGS
jgi:hypothetical protein